MNHFKTNKILVVTVVAVFVLLASGCGEKRKHHDVMHNELVENIDQANSRADHEQIATDYENEANSLLKQVRRHERLALRYQRTDNSKMIWGGDAARHCRSSAKKLREAADELQALANLHRQQAEQATQ